MIKINNASYEDEIHRVYSSFNEDSKNITFCQESKKFWGKDGLKI